MAKITMRDVRHVLGSLVHCAMVDMQTGDAEQRTEAITFLDRIWPTWRKTLREPERT